MLEQLKKADTIDIIWGVVGLLVLLSLASIAFTYIRRKVKESQAGINPENFSLQDIKIMRDNNQISEEEFKVLKDQIIQKY